MGQLVLEPHHFGCGVACFGHIRNVLVE
jgi:hypothetical protein